MDVFGFKLSIEHYTQNLPAPGSGVVGGAGVVLVPILIFGSEVSVTLRLLLVSENFFLLKSSSLFCEDIRFEVVVC